MCNCIKEKEDKLKEKLFPDAERISLNEWDLLSGKTFSTFTIKQPNVKKESNGNIFHTYCPFCGEKYKTT